MRHAVSILVGCLPLSLALITGCPAEAPPPRAVSAPAPRASVGPPEPPRPAYLLGDPDALPAGTTIALDGGAFGAVIDGARVLVRGEEIQVAKEVAASPILGASRVPARLGGGFLFRATNALYTSPTFDGALRAAVALEDGVKRVSFAPKGVLVRTDDSHRHLVDLASGAALPIAPLGLVDVLMLDDGRAAAILEGGGLIVSHDGGEHWHNFTANLGVTASALISRPEEIWIETTGGLHFRVEPGQGLRQSARLPADVPELLRARDPAWRGAEAPLVAAVRRGVALDDGAAIVAAAGDVARVDLRTGAVKMLSRGRLPADLPCEAWRRGDEVLAVCAELRRPSVVVTHLLDESPTIERTFPVEGPFYVGDDGTLAFSGSCDGTRLRDAVCVREGPGVWRSHGAPAPSSDAGAVPPGAAVRWVLDEKGHPFALLGGASPGTRDPDTGDVQAWKAGANTAAFPEDVVRALEPSRVSDRRDEAVILDRRWSMREGVLRGWLDTGQLVKIRKSGDVERSASVFPRAATAGAFGLALDAQGRVFQSVDRGEAWAEVAPPPVLAHATRRALTDPPVRCSPVGCAIGPWLRLGWDAAPPPIVPAPPPPVALPLRAPRAPLPEIACVAAGNERLTVLPKTNGSPYDFGLGARRVPTGHQNVTYERYERSRELVDWTARAWTREAQRVPRALIHGWSAEFWPPSAPDSPRGLIRVLGPGLEPETNVFHRDLAFLEPFEPTGAVRSAGFGLRDFEVALRSFDAPPSQLFAPGGPAIEAIAPVVPRDPAGATGLVFTLTAEGGQILGTLAGGASPRFKIAGARLDETLLTPVSAVELGGGEVAVLLIGSGSEAEVIKLGAAGLSLLRRRPSSVAALPANVDALAVNEQGALAILRTPSGAEPPSADDPALLLPLGGGPMVALAPWSTLTTADDPACRADRSGYRAIVEPVATWLQVRGATRARGGTNSYGIRTGLRPRSLDSSSAPLLARVRWSATRVCLEAVEAADGSRTLRRKEPRTHDEELETAVVARFTGPSPVAGHVGVMLGAELHQPLSCKLVPR